MIVINFLERVKQLKKEKNLTNEDLTNMTGIPAGTLGKLLAGITADPKLTTAKLLADALDTSLDYLSGGDKHKIPTFIPSKAEELMIKKFRALDEHGRDICGYIISKEYDRAIIEKDAQSNTFAHILPPVHTADNLNTITQSAEFNNNLKNHASPAAHTTRKLILPLYNLPVSAGGGIYLDGDDAEQITIKYNSRSAKADFALRVSGNSMEPHYSDSDILLVQEQSDLLFGELGVFICDGEGFFKKFGGDRLISLNSEYDDIPLSSFADISCKGRVIGRLKKRPAN